MIIAAIFSQNHILQTINVPFFNRNAFIVMMVKVEMNSMMYENITFK